jgi:hypothetical protein
MSLSQHQITIKKLQKVLESGDFSHFMGLNESTQFEAKSFSPYQLTGGYHGRLELAKDVAALGNAGGGWIVCGLETINPQKIDVVSDIKMGVEADYYSQSVVKSALNQFISPKIDFELKWFASTKDKTQGLGSIYVPAQEKKLYFYLMVPRASVFPGEKGHFFAIPVRVGADINWLDKNAIKNLTRNQRSSTDQRLNSITEILSEMTQKIDKINHQPANNQINANFSQPDNNLLDTLEDYERTSS